MMNTVISEIFSPHRVRNFAANLSEFCIGFHFHFAFGMWFTVFLTIARDSRLQLNPDIFEPEVGHSVRSRIFRQRTKVGRACSSGVPRSSPAAIAWDSFSVPRGESSFGEQSDTDIRRIRISVSANFAISRYL
jgi:hypothetical protein